jgi:hypothetical protein
MLLGYASWPLRPNGAGKTGRQLAAEQVGSYPIVALEKQRRQVLGKLV